MKLGTWLLLSMVLMAAGSASAADPGVPRYNVVALQAEASRQVQNDQLNATLYVELNDADPAALADALNRRIAEATSAAKQAKGVQVRSGNHRVFPVYAQGQVLEGWRGRADIRLESRDFDAASRLIGQLQASMQLGGLSFSVSPEARRGAEIELIREAIAAFKSRAEIARAALGGKRYRLVRINLGNVRHAPIPRLAMARSASAAQGVASPSLEAGVSEIRVTAEGQIEILD